MRHRIFIAINLPEDIKKRLSDYQKKMDNFTCPLDEKRQLTYFFSIFGLSKRRRAFGSY